MTTILDIADAAAGGAAPAPSVRHYCPGGRESGGGIGRLIGYVADAAAARGDRHAIVDTRGPSWSPLRSAARLLAALALLGGDRIAAPERLHHIHVAGRGSTMRKLILTWVARTLGCVHVLHLHDYDYASDLDGRPAWLRRRIAAMFRGADAVIVLGQRDRKTVEEQLGAAPGRVTVAHNCVPDPGERPRRTTGEPVILFLGRLSPRKGVPELLEALARPEMASLRWRAVLAGDGPVDDYRREAAARGLADRVTMTGWVGEAEVRDLCAGSDILVLPSHAEGMAMAVLEGLAGGLAVVTTRVGSHEEAIIDGETGLFVPVGDPPALAAGLARLVADPGERQRLASAGRRLYLRRFAIDGYLRRLDAFYRATSARRAPTTVTSE